MDFEQIFRFALALVFVVGLIGVLAFVAKRVGFSPRVTRPLPGVRKRLRIVEILPIDAKRRMILVRRDETEHLVLMGADRDLVVESGIPARPEADSPPERSANVRNLLGRAIRPRRGAGDQSP